MKKSVLVLGFALLLVFAFAASAMAATLDLTNSHSFDTNSDYQAPATGTLPNDYEVGKDRIHSHYTQNTNACASCHAVHTAVGEMLLQWESDQLTCEACHNGTLGPDTYDVIDGTIGDSTSGKQTWGGAFNANSGSDSMHNVLSTETSAMRIGAAPGGDVDNKDSAGSKWNKEFGCTSCHDPHGTAGNGRILSPTVNDANYSTGYVTHANGNTQYAQEFATKAKNLTQFDTEGKVWVARNPVVVGAQGTYAAALGDPDQNPGEYAKLMAGHGYTLNVYTNNDGSKLGTGYSTDNSNPEYTKFVFTTAQTVAPKATYTAALRVVMDVKNYLADNEQVTYVKGMNDFCGACHTDYNTGNFNKLQAADKNGNLLTYKSGPYYVKTSLKDSVTNESQSTYNVLNGFYHEAYRHAVGRFSGNATQIGQGLQFEKIQLDANGTPEVDKSGNPSPRYVFVCTTCHVAHGTNETVWNNFKTQVGTDGKNLKNITSPGQRFDGPETSDNSRLKRMPNMATCETCHDKGNVFNTMGY